MTEMEILVFIGAVTLLAMWVHVLVLVKKGGAQ